MDLLNKVIPVYKWFVHPIESKGIPSFPIALIMFIFLIALFFLLFSTSSSSFFSFLFPQDGLVDLKVVVSSSGAALAGAKIDVLQEGISVGKAETNELGVASFKNLKKIVTTILVSKEYYEQKKVVVDLASRQMVRIELSCVNCVSGVRCGDGICSEEKGEDCKSCPNDCGICEEQLLKCISPRKLERKYNKCIFTCDDIPELAGKGAAYNPYTKLCEIRNDFHNPEGEGRENNSIDYTQRGSLIVRVVDSFSGRGVANATVNLYDGRSRNPIEGKSSKTDSFGGTSFGGLALDSIVYAFVSAKEYFPYDGFIQGNQVVIGRGANSMEVRLSRVLPDNSNVSVITVVDNETGERIPATIKVFYSTSPIIINNSFSETGILELLLRKGSSYVATANASGYLAGRSNTFNAGEVITIRLKRVTSSNTASLSVYLKDEYGQAVERGTISLFDREGGNLIYAPKQTDSRGVATWGSSNSEFLERNSRVFVSAQFNDLYGSASVFLENASNSVTIVIEKNWGNLRILSYDKQTGAELNANVYASWDNGRAECNGFGCSLRVKSRPKRIQVNVSAEGYLNQTTYFNDVPADGTASIRVELVSLEYVRNVYTELQGLFDMQGNPVLENYLNLGRNYTAKFRVISLRASRNGLYFRVANDSRSNEANIISYTPLVEGNFSQTYSSQSCSVVPFSQGRSYKWGYVSYPTAPGVYDDLIISYNISIPRTGFTYPILKMFYWAVAKKDNSFIRDPYDQDYNEGWETSTKMWCNAETKSASFNIVDPSLTCSEENCLRVCLLQGSGVPSCDNYYSAVSVLENRSYNLPENPVYAFFEARDIPFGANVSLIISVDEGHGSIEFIEYPGRDGSLLKDDYSGQGLSTVYVNLNESAMQYRYSGIISGKVALLPLRESPLNGAFLNVTLVLTDSNGVQHLTEHKILLYIRRQPIPEPYCEIIPETENMQDKGRNNVLIRYYNLIRPPSNNVIRLTCGNEGTNRVNGCSGNTGSCTSSCTFNSFGSKIISAEIDGVYCQKEIQVDGGPRCRINLDSYSISTREPVRVTVNYENLREETDTLSVNFVKEQNSNQVINLLLTRCSGLEGECNGTIQFPEAGRYSVLIDSRGAQCTAPRSLVVNPSQYSQITSYSLEQTNYSSRQTMIGQDGFEAFNVTNCQDPVNPNNCKYSYLKIRITAKFLREATSPRIKINLREEHSSKVLPVLILFSKNNEEQRSARISFGQEIVLPFSAERNSFLNAEILLKPVSFGLVGNAQNPGIEIVIDNDGTGKESRFSTWFKIIPDYPTTYTQQDPFELDKFDCNNEIKITCNRTGLYVNCGRLPLVVDTILPADLVKMNVVNDGGTALFNFESSDGSAGCYRYYDDKKMLIYDTTMGNCPENLKVKGNSIEGSQAYLRIGCTTTQEIKRISINVIPFSQRSLYLQPLINSRNLVDSWPSNDILNKVIAMSGIIPTYSFNQRIPRIMALVNQMQNITAREREVEIRDSRNTDFSSLNMRIKSASVIPFAHYSNSINQLYAIERDAVLPELRPETSTSLAAFVNKHFELAKDLAKSTACRRSHGQLWWCERCNSANDAGKNCWRRDSQGTWWDCRPSYNDWLRIENYFEEQNIRGCTFCNASFIDQEGNRFECDLNNPPIWSPNSLSCSKEAINSYTCDDRCKKYTQGDSTFGLANFQCGESIITMNSSAREYPGICVDIGGNNVGPWKCTCDCELISQIYGKTVSSCSMIPCQSWCDSPNCDRDCSPFGTKTVLIPRQRIIELNSSPLVLERINLLNAGEECLPLKNLTTQPFKYSAVFVVNSEIDYSHFTSQGISIESNDLCEGQGNAGAYLITFSYSRGNIDDYRSWTKTARKLVLNKNNYVPPISCGFKDTSLCFMLYTIKSRSFDCIQSITDRNEFSRLSNALVGATKEGSTVCQPNVQNKYAVSSNGYVVKLDEVKVNEICSGGCGCCGGCEYTYDFKFSIWTPNGERKTFEINGYPDPRANRDFEGIRINISSDINCFSLQRLS